MSTKSRLLWALGALGAGGAGVGAYFLFGRRNAPASEPLGASALAITTASLASATEGSAYSYTLSGAGGATPYTWGISGLPKGLSATSGGVLSGTAAESGNFLVRLTLQDSSGQEARITLTLSVGANPGGALAVPEQVMGHATVGKAFSYALEATGGNPPYSWQVAGLSGSGMSASATGLISGTPAQAGTLALTLVVTDSVGATAARKTGFVVKTASTVGPMIPQQTLPALTVGVGVTFQMQASGGTGSLVWSASGLPPGLAIDAAGVVSGTPTSAQGSPFTTVFKAVDQNQSAASRSTLLYVAAAASSSSSGSGESSTLAALAAQVKVLETQLTGVEQAIAQDKATFAQLHSANVADRAKIAALKSEVAAYSGTS